ncbi:MAG: hypothetical protein HOE58_09935 [Porticoccaceae bacterium]|nr:hypothetical protein [Porticoccaceae bacterium]MBT4211555.1 hypothetical protein [Porticoccaceae bacterium]MBT4591466.1 hypothetical protein [Porticoccaceae bacterium]MBT5102521.1 hypothetical protein [Porticoccaceae bacterium]MBT6422904.1 hypothetical protein [Porticoccaceae bacterium]
MNTTLFKIIAIVPGIPLLANALLFIVQPSTVVADLGMPLLDGIGRSTQLADLGAFFAFSAVMTIYGVIKSQSELLRLAALLLGMTAVLRVLAWVAHGAGLATSLIAAEVVLVVWLVASAAYMDKLALSSNSAEGKM